MNSLNCSNISNANAASTTNCQGALKMELAVASTERIVVFSLIYGVLFVLSLVGGYLETVSMLNQFSQAVRKS